ncbi:hypothetical protein [Marinisporobacter balticus]|uniref:Uncharacterized protein n=1 Tax=Marinisporobacter balticus TaxID=2018667 RepID=A0A4R2KA67_9FIRM|nr:hypothetical protein [Marinisporobacter balticus]TCO69052.1 hypothetical protein EV214_1353 [Marinisporobacter balticus]
MYKQFCKNFKNFLQINESKDYRYKIGREIEVLTNVDVYNQLKERKNVKYRETANFIFEISQYEHQYPSIKKFVWELWGYGFDVKRFDEVEVEPRERIEEKVKLIDLLLGTHYWA